MKPDYADDLDIVLSEVYNKIDKVKNKYPENYNSAHEGYAILKEEVEEFWVEVKKNETIRDKIKMREELFDIMTVAARCILELT